ncbi:unnamed protein product [Lactuca virosa]|uniref:Large ribosomal subunit protein bL12 oligomerization domain-containing protein n=1 Tax=Lactuca virosa TaxID=75947 RepID=A0AAU9LXI1_9ASTR|nr:unnamed protein product [Lactuca virosa]
MAVAQSSSINEAYSPLPYLYAATTQAASPAVFSPKQTLEFPLRTPKLSYRSTFLRPVAAVAEGKVVELGDEISNLTLADAQKLVEYLQDKLGVTAASFAPAAVVAAPGAGAEAPAAEIIGSSTTPEVPMYPLQLDVVKHLVKLSPVRAVLACVFGNCILYGGNDYSSTMSGSLTDGPGFLTLNRWIQMQTNLHRVSEVAVTAEHSVNDGIEAKTYVKRFREHDSDSDLEHDELAAVGTNSLSVLTDTTNESGIWQDSPKSEAAEIDTTIFLSFGWENEKPYEKAVEKFKVLSLFISE